MKSLIIIWTLAIVMGLTAFGFVSHVIATAAVCQGYPSGQCEFNPGSTPDKQCVANSTCTNSQANYFDGCGNEYDYQGNLIKQGNGCQPVVQPTTIENQPATVTQSPSDFGGKL